MTVETVLDKSTLESTLKETVDATSFERVLAALSNLAKKRAEEFVGNWGNTPQVNYWNRMSDRIKELV